MLHLPQGTLPVYVVIKLWPESRSTKIFGLFLLVLHFNPVYDSQVAFLSLQLVKFVVLAKRTIVHFVSDLLRLLEVSVP